MIKMSLLIEKGNLKKCNKPNNQKRLVDIRSTKIYEKYMKNTSDKGI